MKRRILLIILLTLIAALLTAPSAWSQKRDRGTRSIGWVGTPVGSEIPQEYKIQINDIINITVWKNPDLSGQVKVNPDGNVFVPLAGKVKAAGLTLGELREVLIKTLLRYVRFVEVTVALEKSAGSTVVVLGEVQYPGLYSYEGYIDVVSAIGLAGDFLGTAKRESVIIISDNFTDHPKARRVNIFGSFYRGTSSPDFILKPNDVVYVPKTFIADWNKTIADLQPTIQTLFNTNFMAARNNVKRLYYNVDKPLKSDGAD